MQSIASLVIGLIVVGCTGDDDYGPIEEYARAMSPDDEVTAYVYHYSSPTGGLTQVMLEFDGLGCGIGSASWYEYDIGVGLHWVDTETLEVTYPDGKIYSHNASGDLVGCFDRGVRVVMAPRRSGDIAGGEFSEPVESGHLPSPDRKTSAYTFRYDSPQGGIAQVIVNFLETRGCADSAVTFYDHEIDLQLGWVDDGTLEVRYPDGQRYDHPPWGTTVPCVGQNVEVRMRPVTHTTALASSP